MSSLESAQIRQALAKGVVRFVMEDTAIGLRLQYVGSGSVTTVAATQATSVVLTTSDGGTDTYLFSSYSTLGALADAINADGIFEAVVIDALRSENPDDFFITSASIAAGTDGNGVTCYDLLIDTSASLTQSVCLSPLNPQFDMPKGHRVSLQEIFYNVNNTAAADGLTVWKRKGTVETELFHMLNVDATDTTVSFASGEGKITLAPDEEFIVQVDGTVATAPTLNFIRLVGIYE